MVFVLALTTTKHTVKPRESRDCIVRTVLWPTTVWVVACQSVSEPRFVLGVEVPLSATVYASLTINGLLYRYPAWVFWHVCATTSVPLARGSLTLYLSMRSFPWGKT